MIPHPSSDKPYARVMYGVFFVIGVIVIYFATLFRKDAWLILAITFALYGIFRVAGRLLAGLSEVAILKLEKVTFYLFVVSALSLVGYCFWAEIIPMKFFG
ncbi:MAG: hypothetical protein ACIAZJ_18160 [Gimesia chilikensis]|uniref:hypothetical protein n=1 Tax=Gimesia chilikensis TaxID=2605989 RepID=UPI0037A150F5